jgi:putative PIN family toxin of toxin-antitoxin system
MTGGPAVIDTNVVVSGVLTRLAISPTARILDGMLSGRFRHLLSIELLAEYRDVLLRPKIRRRHGLSEVEVDVLLTEIAANGVVLEPERSGRNRRRGGDEHLWELVAAAAGDSAVLVTGDQKLIDEPVGGTRVMTARAFADSLQE